VERRTVPFSDVSLLGRVIAAIADAALTTCGFLV